MSILTCYRAYCAYEFPPQLSCVTVVTKECDVDGCKEIGSSSVCGSAWKMLEVFKACVKDYQRDEITVVTASNSDKVNENYKVNLVEVRAEQLFKKGLGKVQNIQLTNIPKFFVEVVLSKLEK